MLTMTGFYIVSSLLLFLDSIAWFLIIISRTPLIGLWLLFSGRSRHHRIGETLLGIKVTVKNRTRWSSVVQNYRVSATSGISCWRLHCSHVFLSICCCQNLFRSVSLLRFNSWWWSTSLQWRIILLILTQCFFVGLFRAFDHNSDNHIDFKEISCGVSACCRGPLAERQKCKYFHIYCYW